MRTVSLSRRFVLVVALALIAVGAAGVAAATLRSQSPGPRASAASEQADLIAERLAQRLIDQPDEAAILLAPNPSAPPSLKAFVTSWASRLADGSAGYCTREGTLVVVESVAPGNLLPGRVPSPPSDSSHLPVLGQTGLLPLDQHVVEDACRKGVEGSVQRVRFAAPSDILFVSVVRRGVPLSAWTLARSPRQDGVRATLGWALNIGVIAVTTLLLGLLIADTLRVLRRGSAELEESLARLRRDLRAAVSRPQAREFARIAEGIQSLAANLADAQDRERDLQLRLSHEQRLAGLGRVVAGVAHEIRNPLTGIKLLLGTMARRRLDDRSAADVATCEQEIARLDGVVSSLLLVARKDRSNKERFDLSQLVDERLLAARDMAGELGIRLRREGVATALGNVGELTRVVDNLVRNAVEASPQGGEVCVRLSQRDDATQLAVMDSGPGVPTGRVGELFEPFFSLKPEGTGLGLFLARSLVEAHGGKLTYTRCDATTLFSLSLPTHDAPATSFQGESADDRS